MTRREGDDVELAERLGWVPVRMTELLKRYRVPGGSVAVWHDGEEYVTAAGLANVPAAVEATPETLFLTGSITKVYTATLVMQFVDEGKVELDAPVLEYLPELRLGEPDATKSVTVRQLLSHTNGITGDYLPDTGRGDDAVERYVEKLADAGMLYEPGAMFSYSNSAFVLTGRLVERLTGGTWDAALRSRLLDPLGTPTFVTLPEEALGYRVGVGHVASKDDDGWTVGQMWPELRCGGPAGFTPWATSADLVRFARLHLGDGVTPDGDRVLSSASVTAMQAREVSRTPSGSVDNDGWGLGWARFRYGESERVIGHNGGGSATLRVLPDRNTAIAVLTNATGGNLVGHHLVDDLVGELFDVSIPPGPPTTTTSAEAFAAYQGVYGHHTVRRSVTMDGDTLKTADGSGQRTAVLEPIGETAFLAREADSDVPLRAAFLEPDDDGRPEYLHIGMRAFRRVVD